MKKQFFLVCLSLVVLIFITSCDPQQKPETEIKTEQQPTTPYNPYLDSKITVEVFKVDSIETNGSRGWGYDIMIDGKIYIHQPNVPAVMGNNGFSSEELARTAGEYIVSKIMKNILPPSVTPEELDSLGLLE